MPAAIHAFITAIVIHILVAVIQAIHVIAIVANEAGLSLFYLLAASRAYSQLNTIQLIRFIYYLHHKIYYAFVRPNKLAILAMLIQPKKQ